ncbi:hypothetical protein FV234_11455 [Methylobacterium sp. WL8]|nr:hypothetical protein FV234_11455 [Methylobacterium sp. WL8]
MTLLCGLCENVAHALLAQRRLYNNFVKKEEQRENIGHQQRQGAIIRADENALLTASWKSVRWLKIAMREGVVPASLGDRFFALEANLKDVRDMREHDDQYRLGKGRYRDRHLHRDAESGTAVTADWTFIHHDRYLIGGRLLLSDLSLAVRHLFCDLTTGGFWPLPWEDLGIAESGPLPGEEAEAISLSDDDHSACRP